MIYRHPHFTEYIMARLVTLAVATGVDFQYSFVDFYP